MVHEMEQNISEQPKDALDASSSASSLPPLTCPIPPSDFPLYLETISADHDVVILHKAHDRPFFIDSIVSNPKTRSSYSMARSLEPGTRFLLSREPEQSYSIGALVSCILSIASLLYTLYVQLSSSWKLMDSSSWLLAAIVFKESCILSVVSYILLTAIATCIRHILSLLKRTKHKEIVSSLMDIVDSMALNYIRIISEMGKHSSCLLQIGKSILQIQKKEINASLADFDRILLSVANTILSLAIMLEEGKGSNSDNSNGSSNSKGLLISILMSLLSLLITLTSTKLSLRNHYDVLKDMNRSRLLKSDILLYFEKLQEDFLRAEPTYTYVQTLGHSGPWKDKELFMRGIPNVDGKHDKQTLFSDASDLRKLSRKLSSLSSLKTMKKW